MNKAQKIFHKPHTQKRSPYILWLLWTVWLPFALPAIISLFRSRTFLLNLIITLVGIILFFAIYLWTSWQRAQQLTALSADNSTTWLPILILMALSICIILINGKEWFILFYFISGYIGGRFSTLRTLLIQGGLILLMVALGLLIRLELTEIGQLVFVACVIGIISFSIMRSVTVRWELHAAQEEIARLAVTTERLRIARDLHDLLGHNLSLITLKSELARRLISIAPERASTEIGDIEQVARTTLQEVREAVASYRLPTLPNELQNAHEILAAAGIAYHYTGDDGYMLPGAIEAALAWTVREGVTNIIRHSRARQCTLCITSNTHNIRLELINDGASLTPIDLQASSSSNTGNRGTGLRGLAERIDILHGQFNVGPRSDGNFCLSVSLPLIQKADTASPALSKLIMPMPTPTKKRSEPR